MTKILPARRYHVVPRPLWSDAYTINGHVFESQDATENSVYYGTYRKFPLKHEPAVYGKHDSRILFSGLQPLCDMLFFEPITHKEIDDSIEFLKGRKATMVGFTDWEFPEDLWRRVVDECEGYLPIHVEGIPEGGVVYPGEPCIRVKATKPGFGPLVPWFESTLLHVWSASERLTAARHCLRWAFDYIRSVELDSVTDDECLLFARLMIHDMGDRGATCPQESELVAKVHNYVWTGTDTFRAAYQNWKNGANPVMGSSVKALAHRIVQGFEAEFDCYEQMYNTAQPGELLSMVADCYDYFNAVENKLIPLALRSKADGSGKIIVARPDSGNSEEMVLGTLQRAEMAGLMQQVETKMGRMKASTTLRFIVGNGETFQTVKEISEMLICNGFIPWRCGIFGIGGHLRNNITRDHMSTKFALCAVGKDNRPVIKFSEERGKQTLPNVKVVRSEAALKSGITLELPEESGSIDALVTYYDGSADAPFGPGFTDDFATCEDRVVNGFKKMPPIGGHVTASVDKLVEKLSHQYRSNKENK